MARRRRPAQPKVRQPARRPNPPAQTRTARGTDIVLVTQVTQDTAYGTILARAHVTPRAFMDTRIFAESEIYTKWRPRRLTFEVSSAAGQMMPGSYMMAFIEDANPVLPSSADNLIKYFGSIQNIQASIGQSRKLVIPSSVTQNWLYCRSDVAEESVMGTFFLILTGSIGSNGSIGLTIKLNWDLELTGYVSSLTDSGSGTLIFPQSGWDNVFTDSSSDLYEGTVLTFKHAEGGEVVPWQNIQQGFIYKPMPGTTIQYIDGTSAVKNCTYFSACKVAAFSTALMCHKSEGDAKSYQQTGGKNFLIGYTAAGPWAKPPVPLLNGTKIAVAVENDLKASGRKKPPSVAVCDYASNDLLSDVYNCLGNLTQELKTLNRETEAMSSALRGVTGPLFVENYMRVLPIIVPPEPPLSVAREVHSPGLEDYELETSTPPTPEPSP